MEQISRHLLHARLTDRLSGEAMPPDIATCSTTPLEEIASDQEFITEAFRRILARDPDLEAVEHFLRVLRSHPRCFVVDYLLAASTAVSESNTACKAPMGRDASGRAPAGGGASEAGASGIVTPPECTLGQVIDLTMLDGLSDPSQFVSEMYKAMLGRPADFEGFVHHRDLLIYGTPKAEVVALVAASPEAAARNVQFTWGSAPLDGAVRVSLTCRIRMLLRKWFRPKEMEDLERAMWRVSQHAECIAERHGSISSELGRFIVEQSRASAAIAGMHDSIKELVAAHSSELGRFVVEQSRTSAAIAGVHDSIKELVAASGQTNSVVFSYLSDTAPRLVEVEQSIIRSDQQAVTSGQDVAEMKSSLGSLRGILEDNTAHMQHEAEHLKSITASIQDVQERLSAARQAIRPPVLTGRDVLVMNVDDFVLAVAREDWTLAACYAFWGSAERGLTLYLQSILRQGMVFVDVGANVGIHTLHAARAVGATGAVHSFEPDPTTFRILQQNMRVNGVQQVELHQVALLDRNCEVPLYRTEGLSGWSTLYASDGGGGSVPVKCTTLDEELQNVDRIDVVKIDAEGAEPAILRGMQRTLERNPGIQLLIEYAPSHLRRAGVSPAQFLEALYAKGFQISEVDRLSGELLTVDPEQLSSVYSANLCLRSSGTGMAKDQSKAP